jgi:hypothetical protein
MIVGAAADLYNTYNHESQSMNENAPIHDRGGHPNRGGSLDPRMDRSRGPSGSPSANDELAIMTEREHRELQRRRSSPLSPHRERPSHVRDMRVGMHNAAAAMPGGSGRQVRSAGSSRGGTRQHAGVMDKRTEAFQDCGRLDRLGRNMGSNNANANNAVERMPSTDQFSAQNRIADRLVRNVEADHDFDNRRGSPHAHAAGASGGGGRRSEYGPPKRGAGRDQFEENNEDFENNVLRNLRMHQTGRF